MREAAARFIQKELRIFHSRLASRKGQTGTNTARYAVQVVAVAVKGQAEVRCIALLKHFLQDASYYMQLKDKIRNYIRYQRMVVWRARTFIDIKRAREELLQAMF